MSAFLAEGKGVYTTMRSVHRSSIFSFDQHMQRLALVGRAVDPNNGTTFSTEEIEALVLPAIKQEMEAFAARMRDGEMKLVVGLRVRGAASQTGRVALSDVEVCVAAEPLGEPATPTVAAECAEGARQNPTVKHADWIEQRRVFEQRMRRDCNEVVLVENGQLLEGLSSNFALLDDSGTLYTAPADSVLEGTVLQLVLQVCSESGIPVVRRCPTLSQIKDCSCASVFITSTSRLALPVHTLYLPDGSELKFGITDKARIIIDRVRGEVEANSKRII